MKSYDVLAIAIPRAESGRVGQMLGIGGSMVRKWRREPPSDDAPTGTGQRSILDRFTQLLDAVWTVYPKGAGLIMHHVQAHHDRLIDTHAQPIPCRDTQAAAGANLLNEATQAINALQVEGCTNETLRELIELRDTADATIKSVEKTMSLEENNP